MTIFHRDEFVRKQADDAFAKAFNGREARDKDGRWVSGGATLKDTTKVPRNANGVPLDPADRFKMHTKPRDNAKAIVQRVAKEHKGDEALAFRAVLSGKSRSDQRAFVASKLDSHGTNGKKEATRLRAI